VVLIVLAIGAAIGLFFIIRRNRYINSLKQQGWNFENSPTLAATYGLNCPPSGSDSTAGSTI
jgi:hypothetical protein